MWPVPLHSISQTSSPAPLPCWAGYSNSVLTSVSLTSHACAFVRIFQLASLSVLNFLAPCTHISYSFSSFISLVTLYEIAKIFFIFLLLCLVFLHSNYHPAYSLLTYMASSPLCCKLHEAKCFRLFTWISE